MYTIATLDGPKEFIPSTKQDLFLKATSLKLNVISRLTRQAGYSQVMCISALDEAIKSKTHVAICTHKNIMSVCMIDRIKETIVLSGLSDKVQSMNKHVIQFKNGSVIEIESYEKLNNPLRMINFPYDVIYFDAFSKRSVNVILTNIDKYNRWVIGYQYSNGKNDESSPCQTKKEYRRTISKLIDFGATLIDFRVTDGAFHRTGDWEFRQRNALGDEIFNREYTIPTLHKINY